MPYKSLAHSALALGIFTAAVASLPLACDSTVLIASNSFRAVAAACAFDWQCAGGECSADEDGGSCGVCLDRLRIGDRCDKPLSTCSSTAVCTDGVCQSTKGTAGAPCEMGAKGGSDDCDIDFYCAGDWSSPGVCTAKPDFGEACGTSPFASCARGGDCERGICVRPREASLGESCDSRPCMQGLACHSYDDGHTCEDPNLVPLNESCAPHIGNLDCEKGTACELTGGPMGADGYYPMACLAKKTEGMECGPLDCVDGFKCRRAETTTPEGFPKYTCQRLRLAGETCTFADDCNAGLECRNGTCLAECQ